MSPFTQLHNIIISHSNILIPIFRSTCFLLGITMTVTSVFTMLNPVLFATNFGIPIRGNSESVNGLRTKSTTPKMKSRTLSSSPNRQVEAGIGWLTIFAGREGAIGVAVLALLWMDEPRALSAVVSAVGFVAAGDTLATYRHGEKGSFKKHLYPGIAFLWVGPLGLLLFGSK
ncbi:hypothetical protein VTL71DRAFT_9165 [Oculimacula yallundae]|uniref:Uncharacterized protein n=1 Tax=Oculimacula yallundae TaxID=86028 RepID=A0ABR4BS88_9HELO